SYFLLNELKTNERPLITLSELSNNVEKAVANNVEQVPESGVLHGAGDELGEFVFI
ncbi:MAG: caspase family protein, partial [Gammaproteobacteria bacterium]|nr:caspase family protein [Gammaproteobacteria bacterium]NIR96354.1 caspase family protein [Gammaproteobacteria bacterium]